MDPVAATDLIANHDLHWIDGLVIVFYLLGITLMGLWIGRRVSTLNDFFMPRSFGKGMMVMHAFGTGTASDQAVTVSSATFRSGLSGVWYQWLWLFVTPFYWLIAPIFRRFRAVTTADVYELRYDRSVAVLFAVIGIANMCIKIGLMLVGAGALVDAGTGGLINADLAIVSVTVMFVIYGTAGGLSAAILTDYVQGILTIVFSFMLLPLILLQVGGIDGVRETITDDSMLSLVAPGKISLFFIMMMSFQALIGIVAQPFIMGVCAAGKTEWEGRVGIVGGNLIKRLCTAAWSITAICAVAWYIQKGNDPTLMDPSTLQRKADGIYGEVAYYFLPRLMPGLLGLFLAALLAGIMSSCDSFMISSAALFTENIYKPMRLGASERHCIWVGRAASSLVVLGGVSFAFWVEGVVQALEIWFMVAPMIGLVFWLGLFWRGMTVAGAWATTVTGFLVWWVTTQDWFIGWLEALPVANSLGMIWEDVDSVVIYLPWQILCYSVIASVVGVLVSLVTPRVSSSKLNHFYLLSRTPIQPNENLEAPCTLPLIMPEENRRMLCTSYGLEIPIPSAASVIGFLVIWSLVGGIIGSFIWFVS